MDGQIKAAIDADFFINITEYERGTGLFLKVMKALGIKPFMHKFVADCELRGNAYLKELIDAGEISVADYEDYLTDENRTEYEEYFRDAYEKINYRDFQEKEDIYKCADKDESLGEIRSLYMADKMGYIYFMSDDADARMLAKKFISSKKALKVQSLFDVFVMCKERNTGLRWKDINPTVANAMRKRQGSIEKLKEIYSN